MYQYVIDNLFDGVYYVDLGRKISFWSKGAERITGYRSAEVVGVCCSDNILRHIDAEGNELCLKGCPLVAAINDNTIHDANVYLHHKRGHRVPVRVRGVPITDELGAITGAAEIFQDISKRSDLIKELEILKQETLLDELTGIGNRRMANISLQDGFRYLARENVSFGVVLLDIDDFKKINDTHGHNVGDKVLKMIAKTVSNMSRPLDTVSRWGGEEFMVAVTNSDLDVLQKISERIRSFVEKGWLMVDGKRIQVTVSVGATLAKAGGNEKELFERVDALMYKSKKAGKNMVSVV